MVTDLYKKLWFSKPGLKASFKKAHGLLLYANPDKLLKEPLLPLKTLLDSVYDSISSQEINVKWTNWDKDELHPGTLVKLRNYK